MDRNPPSDVKKLLRQEVNYGCPVPGCGSPFLTWHHFDPPWSVKEHHNPDSMIALCTQCHPMADAGAYSSEQFEALKGIQILLNLYKRIFRGCFKIVLFVLVVVMLEIGAELLFLVIQYWKYKRI
ncbi:MAG: hypothetical protein AB1921_12755 [Thermodesulfobacteriota bacterium]